MGWFDEQIKSRIKNNKDSFKNSFLNLSSVVLGESVIASAFEDEREKAQNAIDEILKFYHVKQTELPDNITNLNDILEYLLRPSGIMRRSVKLNDEWYKKGTGALLGQTIDGDVIALIPLGFSGYNYFDYKSGKYIKINKNNCKNICEEAICFYKPLPANELNIKDLLVYILQSFSKIDYLLILSVTLFSSLLGLFTPYINKIVFGQVIPSGAINLLIPLSCLLIGITISTMLMNIVKSLVLKKLQTKTDIAISSASIARLMSLPADFFKNYNSGELTNRLLNINSLCSSLIDVVFSSGLSSLFSFIYFFQIFYFAPSLVIPALIMILFSLLSSVILTVTQIKNMRNEMNFSAKLSGLVFGLFSGIQKIKLSGAEHRAFQKWSLFYKPLAKIRYDPEFFIKIGPIFSVIISMTATIIFYYNAVVFNVSTADYMAFNTAFGMISGVVASFSSILYTAAKIKPTIEMIDPILKAKPEVSINKHMVSKITGSIELNNVCFRYKTDTPNIIDDLSLKIKAGQYIAIVGKSGCGKSTLMRLLLGFEKPQRGAIYYDGKDMEFLDLKSLRRNMGVVMQNGKLFAGDIYSNITVSAPWLTTEEAMQAARDAGMEDDIKNMPMGLHTIISEGGGGISGGQKQRLMIARAIAPKPKILLFDEATSALDNITQKQVSESLDKLKCTRIVIAHRLSTIKQCDRIIVLDKGKIIEDGTFEELIANGGFFAELVERQRI